MNTDIRISVQFINHPKTIKLERRLGFQGVKSLIELWSWAALNRPDGNLGGGNDRLTTVQHPLDEEDIEIAAQWPGEPGVFIETLVELRWLDQNEQGYTLHEWLQHNPWVAGVDNRGNKARFSRMAKTHPEIYKTLREQGIDEISAQEFARLKAEPARLTTVERSFNDSSTTVDTLLTPSPSPSPSPYEEEKRETERWATCVELSTPVISLPIEPSTPIDLLRVADTEILPVTLPIQPVDSTLSGQSGQSSTKEKAIQDLPPAPDWLPESVWQAFIDHRRALKKPLTPQAARLTLHHLDKARGYGHNPVALVETAIASGWRGCVFEDKHFQPSAPPRTPVRSYNGHRRPLREPTTNPAEYLETAGFATELEVTV